MTVELRNKGPAPAYGLDVWLTDSDGTALTHRYAHPEAVAPGDPAGSMPIWRRHHSRAPRIGRPDVAAEPQPGAQQVWIGWHDVRGPQKRDTKIRI